MFEQMLELDDPLVAARVETICVSEQLSVVTFATMHFNSLVNSHQAQQQGQQQTPANFNQDMQSRAVVERYIGVMRMLLKHPTTSPYLNECLPRWEWMRSWAQNPVSGSYQQGGYQVRWWRGGGERKRTPNATLPTRQPAHASHRFRTHRVRSSSPTRVRTT